MSVPSFDAKEFYLLENALFTNRTLSGGLNARQDRKVAVDSVRAYSSENWQLFEQGQRFFIRCFDTGPDLQLGVARQNLETPLLYEKSGSLSQQWVITESNGKYVITNALAGKDKFLVVNDDGAVSMQSNSRGSEWLIDMNESAAKAASAPKQPEMYVDVENFEQLSTSSSISPSSATSGLTPISTSLSSTSSSITGSNGSNGSVNNQIGSSSAALSGGAIAGIVVGGIAVLAAIIFAVWFFLFKRKNKQQHNYELPTEGSHQAPHMEKYAYSAELGTPHAEGQTWEADSTQKRPVESRHELA